MGMPSGGWQSASGAHPALETFVDDKDVAGTTSNNRSRGHLIFSRLQKIFDSWTLLLPRYRYDWLELRNQVK